MSLKTSATVAEGFTEASESIADASTERGELIAVDGLIVLSKWLVWASRASSLRSRRAVVTTHIFDVVGLVGLEQQQGARPMCGGTVVAEEVGIAGGDDSVARQQTGVAMVGVQAITRSRSCPQDDVGTKLPNDSGNLAAHRQRAVELAVDAGQEHHESGVVAAERRAASLLFDLSLRSECNDIGIRVPRALRSVRADQVVHDAAGVGPLGQRAATSGFDVVRDARRSRVRSPAPRIVSEGTAR